MTGSYIKSRLLIAFMLLVVLLIPTSRVSAKAPVYTLPTWNQLAIFLSDDHTNWNHYSQDYDCVGFATDLKNNAHQAGYNAWIVGIYWQGKIYGHAIVAFPTSDLGEVYIEPQTDYRYIPPVVGNALCMQSDYSKCFAGRHWIIQQVIEHMLTK